MVHRHQQEVSMTQSGKYRVKKIERHQVAELQPQRPPPRGLEDEVVAADTCRKHSMRPNLKAPRHRHDRHPLHRPTIATS